MVDTLSASAEASAATTTEFWPAPPRELSDTGLILPFIEDHLVRILYFEQQMTGAELAAACGLPYGTLQALIRSLTRDQLIEVVGQSAPAEQNYRYTLAPKGQLRAADALERTWYHGPLPVPLPQYVAGIKAQSLGEKNFRRDDLYRAFSGLELSEGLIDRLGPAINTNHSIFLYGAPGNGKTVLTERIAAMMGSHIFVPHAIEVDGSIILVYDNLNHFKVEDSETRRHDARWIRVRRPSIIAASELTISALDLTRNETGKFYMAPPQMKANGGTFLIDDFGRQSIRPVDLLNRWIVPLEKRIDFMTLQTGTKFEVPFDVLLLISTNLDPASLSDEAFQRRIPFRVGVNGPSEAQFADVFRAVCDQRNMRFDPDALEWLLATWWRPVDRPMRFVQPRNLVTQVIAIARYLGREPSMERDLLDLACRNYFDLDGLATVNAAEFS
jgi:hypothetical protein